MHINCQKEVENKILIELNGIDTMQSFAQDLLGASYNDTDPR